MTEETTSTSLTVSGLKCNTDYNFTVRANGDGVTYFGWGLKSNTSGNTTECPRAPPPADNTLDSTRAVGSSAELRWGEVDVAHGYEVERRVGTTGSWNRIGTTNGRTSTSFTARGLNCNTVYYFRVSARGDGNPHSLTYGDPSGEVKVQLCLPEPPRNFRVNILGMDSAELTWDAVDGAERYNADYRLDSGPRSVGPRQGEVHGLGTTISGLACNTSYVFTVEAYGDGENRRADWSRPAERTARTDECPRAPPPGDNTLTSTRPSGGSAELRWGEVDVAHGYEVERRVGTTGSWSRIGTTNGRTSTSFTARRLNCNTVYYFRVSARGDGNPHSLSYGDPSGEVQVQLCLPPAPNNLRVTVNGETSVTLTWDPTVGADDYRTGHQEVVDSNSRAPRQGPIHGPSETIFGLDCGTTYDFTVEFYGDGIKYRADWGPAATRGTATDECTPEVAITRDDPGTTVYEGDNLDFTLTVTYPASSDTTAPSANLTVNVSVGDPNSLISGVIPEEVVIPANSSTISLSLPTDINAPATGGLVSVSVLSGSEDYYVGRPSVVSILVVDPSTIPGPTVHQNPTSTFDGVRLTWGTVDGATVYRVEYRETIKGQWVTGDVVEEPDPEPERMSHTQDELACNHGYEFRVRSGRGEGDNLVWGSEASMSEDAVTDNLCIPERLGSTGQTSYTVTLSWTAVPMVEAYLVQHRESGMDTWGTETRVTGTTSHTVPGLTCDTEYEFRVTSARISQKGVVDRGGAAVSMPVRTNASCVPTVTIVADDSDSEVNEGEDVVFKVTVDQAPSADLTVGVTVTQEGEYFDEDMAPNSVTISGDSDSAILTIETEADDVDEADGSVTATIDASSTYVLGMPSEATVEIIDLTLAAPDPITAGSPDPSSGLTTHDTIILSWPMVDGADGYRVQHHVSTGTNDPLMDPFHADWESIDNDQITGTTHEITDLLCNTRYVFRVQAGTGGGHPQITPWKGGQPAIVSASTSNLCASASLTISRPVSTPATTSLDLSWDPVDVADFYRISYQKLLTDGNPDPPAPVIAVMGTHAGPDYTVEDLDCDTMYRFSVQSGLSDSMVGELEWGGTITMNGMTTVCPSISITSTLTEVKEGEDITFTIASNPSVSSDLDVNILVTRNGTFVKGTPPDSVKILSGQTEVMLVIETDDDEVDEVDGSVTVEISGPSGSISYTIGTPSSHVVAALDNDPMLDAPTNLNVTPFPLRKARLSWTGDTNASGYVVEVRKPGGIWGTPGNVHNESTSGYEINLESIWVDASTPSKLFSLADGPVYEFRVKAVPFANSIYEESPYSATISLMDNPILTGGSADGKSPDDDQQVLLKWGRIIGALEYTVQYRRLGNRPQTLMFDLDHTHPDWPKDERWPYYQTNDLPDPITIRPSRSPSATVTGLDEDTIYAFRVNLKTNAGEFFSARDAFAWPSSSFPEDDNEDRVATYPYFGHWPDRTFRYTICQNTFYPQDRQTEWGKLIQHAFRQWQESSDGLITMMPSIGNCFADDSPLQMQVLLSNETNEVYMVDTSNWTDIPLLILTQLDVPLVACVYFGGACVVSNDYRNGDRGAELSLGRGGAESVDVLINKDQGVLSPTIPGSDLDWSADDVKFNTCLPKAQFDPMKLLYNPDDGFSNYQLMVHEAGHALGISEYSRTAVLAFNTFEMSHPTIPDAVLNYDDEVRQNFEEPDCAPHPFDIMALYALYQTVDR